MRGFPSLLIIMSLLALIPAETQAQTFPAPQTDSPQDVRRAAYIHKNLVDAYETIGSRNPKWDADARAVLKLSVHRWLPGETNDDLDWQILIIGDRALRAGCDDLAVLYPLFRAHSQLNIRFPTVLLERLDRAATNSRYAPFLKVFTLARLMDKAKSETRKRLLELFYQNLPAALVDSDLMQADIAQLCSDVSSFGNAMYGDRLPMISRMHDIIAKALPGSAIGDLFLGLAYWRYSWDAPGVGAPEERGRRMERHTVAKESFARALKKDPNLAPAAAAMVGTMVDEGSLGPELEKYFQLAIKIDPDCYLAYQYKIGSLNTGAPGAVADVMNFGRTCLATHRWRSRIPFLLLRAHRSIAGEDRAEFYKQTPEAWHDVQNLYEGYIAYNPQSITERMNYANWALQTDHPEIARKQLSDLKPLVADPVLKEIIATQSKAVVAALQKLDATTRPAR